MLSKMFVCVGVAKAFEQLGLHRLSTDRVSAIRSCHVVSCKSSCNENSTCGKSDMADVSCPQR